MIMNGYESRLLTAICLCVLLSEMAASASRRISTSADNAQKCVVLVHGLNRTSLAMKPLELFFKRSGYRVVNVSLPSRRCSVEELADHYLQRAMLSRIPSDTARVDFVTHSLGGIVVRQYLSNHTLPNLGRVVMLAPPNDGSQIADKMKRSILGRWILGASGRQMGTGPSDLPRRLGPARFDVGVIAGDRSLNPVFGCILPRPNDGTISVESAKIAGMTDFLVVHSSHTFIMWRARTFRQALTFLERGHFSRA
jgi:triacylglycerol lipase